ncbi:MAG: hypothetical protein II645_06200 [Bacteroidaceae bacterium]|nr:hypothetical protein [Bacteroidaceae bacterium]MBQ2459275.1 hypothetical protein [Bacteroidaceae bacterium]MBQ2595886.1 hypothetical protein [Bacteroidaceae bacterium]MBQ3992726.1 hypothetical protein [Bacteroidaceae bacterium]MBQ4002889.1 hypothetical protein [Bacteroidaceae bacterium]
MNSHQTYIAFDAYGVIDPVNSNLHTFRQLEVLQRDYPQRFRFLNTQEIDFSALYNDMVVSTLKTKFVAKLSQADNLLVVASPVTNVDSEILNWQISRAVNRFHLPVIVCYAGLDAVDEQTIEQYWTWLPAKIRKYIGRDSARMCHIPLTKDKLERALSAYSLRDGLFPWSSTTIF